MTTELTETDREALRRWARMNGHDEAQAEAIATDPEVHRAALVDWFTTRGLDPAQAGDPATPPDPALPAEWGPTRGVQPHTAQVWASTREDFPEVRLAAVPAPSGGPVGRRPHVYSLAALEAWEGPQRAARVDPDQFGAEERVSVVEFATRTGKDRSTLNKALNSWRRRADQQDPEAVGRVPERGKDRKYNARDLAAFVNSLPGRRGRQAQNRG